MAEEHSCPDSSMELGPRSDGAECLAVSGAVNALRSVIALAFLVTLLISRKLWLSTRDYPLTPVWSRIPQPPYPLDQILFWVMAAALLAVALLPNPRRAWTVAWPIGILWALLDQSRWQPYIVLYMAILACLFVLPFEKRARWSVLEIKWALLPARLIVAFAYLYSGLHKLNHEFATDVFPWMVEPLHKMLHFDLTRLSERGQIALALCAAAGEGIAGVMLLFSRTRRPAVLFLISMHGFILLMIGPFGYKWNEVIWPWNLAMIAALWTLFWRQEPGSWRIPDLFRRAWWREARLRSPMMLPAVVFAFGIMPILSFVGWWDSYLSFSLYSGSTCECEIQIDPEDYKRLPSAARAATDPESGAVDLRTWSISEMGAIPYPEHRIALSVAVSLARCARHGPVLVELGDMPDIMTGQRKYHYFSCAPGGGPARKISSDEYEALR